MRSSALVGILLTLLMLLLVLSAAFIFLFQGRRTLESRNAALETSLETAVSAAETAAAVAAENRDSMASALATVESDSILLEGQLVDSQQELEALQNRLSESEDALAQLEQERLDMLARPPQVTLVSPDESVTLPAGTPVELVVAAADPVGITDMTMTINGRLLSNYVVAGLPLLIVSERWTPVEEGTFLVTVEASNGRTSSVVTHTLSVTAPTSQSSTAVVDPNGTLRADIERSVSEVRGLRPLLPVVTTVLTAGELQARIDAQSVWNPQVLPAVLAGFDFVTGSYEVADIMPSFGLLPHTSYYDAVQDEMLVAGDGGAWSPSAQLAYVHQLVRLLQDQYFDLDAVYDADLDYDATLALSALAGGEVSLVQNLYLRGGYFSDAQIDAIINELNAAAPAELIPVFADEQQFRDETGLNFVQGLYNSGGFEQVAAAWQNPPRSSEQILHPQKYATGELPIEITLPSLTETLGDGWSFLVEDTFGELWLRTYLSQQLNADQVETAVSGWGGGRYAVYTHDSGDAFAMVLWLAWDTLDDSVEFAALYPNYPTALFDTVGQLQPDGGECWQGDDMICLYQRNDVTFIVRAPDLETAVSIAGALENSE